MARACVFGCVCVLFDRAGDVFPAGVAYGYALQRQHVYLQLARWFALPYMQFRRDITRRTAFSLPYTKQARRCLFILVTGQGGQDGRRRRRG